MEKRLEKHRRFLVDRIDPDFGLLDKLLASDTLTREDVHKIKLINNTTEDKNRILLDLHVILKDNKANDLVVALRDSGQSHLVNYTNADGGYVRAFGDDWPLSKADIKRLDINRENLIDLLDTSDLCNRLFSEKVINNRQKQFILTKPTDAEKNEALLDLLIKFSIRQYNKSIACLRDSNQSHIADLFSEGGVLIRVHANLEVENANVEELEDEIISNLTRPLGNLSLDEGTRLLELAKQRFIAAKKGHSIVLYIHCKTPDELLQLIDLLKTNKLKEIVERVFIQLISIGDALKISLTWSSEEFKRASAYFDSDDVSSSGNLQTKPTVTERVFLSTALVEDSRHEGWMREISGTSIPIGKICGRDASTQTDEELFVKNKTGSCERCIAVEDKLEREQTETDKTGKVPVYHRQDGSYERCISVKENLEKEQTEIDEKSKVPVYQRQNVQIRREYNQKPDSPLKIRTKGSVEESKWTEEMTIDEKELLGVNQDLSEVIDKATNLNFRRRCHLSEFVDADVVGSCNRNNCVYIWDNRRPTHQSSEIRMVDPTKEVINNWLTGHAYGCLSITDVLIVSSIIVVLLTQLIEQIFIMMLLYVNNP